MSETACSLVSSQEEGSSNVRKMSMLSSIVDTSVEEERWWRQG